VRCAASALGSALEHPVAAILIVDDNRDLAGSISLLLEARGCDVRVAYDGAEALSEAAHSLPDAIVLDIGLPSMSGFEVARRLRATYGTRVRLVAHTAWSDDETRREVAEAGFDDMLIKPSSIDNIMSAVDQSDRA
jgi:DNA-binding response OmpR family regulator